MRSIHVRDRDYDLEMTVGAFAAISDLCPGRDFGRIDELMQMPMGQAMERTARMVVALSEGAEAQKAFEQPGYEPRPLTFDGLHTLPLPDYLQLHAQFGGILADVMSGRQVEVEPPAKKNDADAKT